MIKHISFDLWGTLITSNPLYREQRNALLSEVFEVPVDAKLVAMGKKLSDDLSEVSGIQVPYAQIIMLMLPECNKVGFLDKVREFDRRNHDLVVSCPPLLINDEIPNLLLTLFGRNIDMGILSNTSIIRASALIKCLANYNLTKFFKVLAFSDVSCIAKPNPDFYLRAVIAKHKPHERLHVGDNPFTDNGGGLFTPFIVTPDNPITNLLTLVDNATSNL